MTVRLDMYLLMAFGIVALLIVLQNTLGVVLALALFVRTLAFPLLGRDYDAAMLIGGLCGFGLGATPNAMANMNAISARYHFSKVPSIVVPIVGAMFLDIINVLVITLFIQIVQ